MEYPHAESRTSLLSQPDMLACAPGWKSKMIWRILMSKKTEFVKVLAMLAAAYPRFTMTEETTEVYAQLLADIPIETLRAAALSCATTRDFFPSVHELRQAVAELARKANSIPSAYEAWQDLKKAGRGFYKEVIERDGDYFIEPVIYEFIHPVVKHVAELL